MLSRLIGLLVALIAIYNANSLPFVWHAKVLTPVFKLWLRRKDPKALIKASLNADPVTQRLIVRGFRVWPSDVDYNLHKSNSTYASDMDIARSNTAIELFGPFLACGGLLPIAGTTHRFLHELPPLAKYDVEISFGGWGDKWASPNILLSYIMYAVGLFVTHPPKGKNKNKTLAQVASSSQSSVSGDLSPAIKRLSSNRPDGAIVHAVSVSTFCFKIGRLTIPPAVVLSLGGHGTPANNARFEKLFAQGPRAMTKYYKGGWKEDDEAVKVVEAYQAQGKAMGDRGDTIRVALEEYSS